MSDSKATYLSSNWRKKKPGPHNRLKSKLLRLIGKILIGKFPSQIVLRKLRDWVSMLATEAQYDNQTAFAFFVFLFFTPVHRVLQVPGRSQQVFDLWPVRDQRAFRETHLIHKWNCMKNLLLTSFQVTRGLWLSKHRRLVSAGLILQNWDGIRYWSLQDTSVGSTQLCQSFLLAQGSSAALARSVVFLFLNWCWWWLPGSMFLWLCAAIINTHSRTPSHLPWLPRQKRKERLLLILRLQVITEAWCF